MKALISFLFGTWMLTLCGGLQAQTRVATTADPIFSRAELDQMLAPIALYPDTVLSHILIAATYPLEVIEAERWIRSNRHLEAEDAVNAAALEGWDPSVAALTAFPDLLGRMSDDLNWTQDLGDAFLSDDGRVMDAIQHLREKAFASGQLKKMKHVKTHRDNRIIVIEPAVERVVYVPYYDTRVVYGPWWWDRHPPVYWHAPTTYLHVGGVYWGPRVYLGSTFFFSSVHWRERRVVVIDHHHRHPHFYSGRKIAHYQGARRWEHNPTHRRNIVYRSEPVRQRYANHDGSRRFSRDWRNEQRDRRDAKPARNDVRREVRNDAPQSHINNQRDTNKQRHISNRERANEVRAPERREQGQIRAPGLPRGEANQDRSKRAEELRQRLSKRTDTPSAEHQVERRNRESSADSRRTDSPPKEGIIQNRREHLQRVQSENNNRDRRAERHEKAQNHQEARREAQTRRAENHQRRERVQPQRNSQQEQRRFASPRGQREGPRSAEREHRRSER